MTHWIEILFGGVGGSALLAAIGWIIGKRPAGVRPIATSAPKHKVGLNEPVRMVKETVVATPDALLPRHIADAIKATAPFARERIAENYYGVQIEWPLKVRQILPSRGGSDVHIAFETGDHFPIVMADVATDRFPFVRFVREGTEMLVVGKVSKASEYEIVLNEVELTVLSARYS